MKPGDTTTFFGTEYIAVFYRNHPANLNPEHGDPQCRICQLAPNFCKLNDECHGSVPFVFVKSNILKAISSAL